MSDLSIARVIDSTLSDLYESLDRLDHDAIDLEMGDGKLQIEFDDGVKLIVSRQSAADQIWLAEPEGGWHYSLRDGRWIDDKRGVDLVTSLEELITARVGEAVSLDTKS